jgi:mRNA interferase MazF
VAVGKASGRKTGQTSYPLCHQQKSFDWRLRQAKAHAFGALPSPLFGQVCERLNQIIQVGG